MGTRASTPIDRARNLGPVSAGELAAVGITTREQLVELGWEQAFVRLVRAFPHRCHLNMCCALIGAVEDLDWRRLPPSLATDARRAVGALRDT
jgi:hypothetical protein